jgi:hypothetical protein
MMDIYFNFVDYWSFPVGILIHYYCKKHNIPVYGEVTIFMVFAPIHIILFIPGVLFGLIAGIPWTIYKYNNKPPPKKDGFVETLNRCS